jgi:hypothetical protein
MKLSRTAAAGDGFEYMGAMLKVLSSNRRGASTCRTVPEDGYLPVVALAVARYSSYHDSTRKRRYYPLLLAPH